jgi:hypothetical protein
VRSLCPPCRRSRHGRAPAASRFLSHSPKLSKSARIAAGRASRGQVKWPVPRSWRHRLQRVEEHASWVDLARPRPLYRQSRPLSFRVFPSTFFLVFAAE